MNSSVKLSLVIFILTLFPALTFAKDSWPVAKLEFTYTGKDGWTPNEAKVKKGSEVRIKLKNQSSAYACFGVFSKEEFERNRDISGGKCVDPKSEDSFLFFANYPKAEYEIRNSAESSKEGRFIIQ